MNNQIQAPTNIKLVCGPDKGFVTYQRILPYKHKPKVLLWGERVFMATGEQDGQHDIYEEVFWTPTVDASVITKPITTDDLQ